MNREATRIEGNTLFGECHDIGKMQESEDGREWQWQWPKDIGNGYMYMIKLRPGLILGIGDFLLTENIEVSFDYAFSPVVLAFSLSGCMYYSLSTNEKTGNYHAYAPGRCIIAYFPEWRGVARPPVNHPVSCVEIYMDPVLFNSFMKGVHNQIPGNMRDLIGGNNEQIYYQETASSFACNAAIQQLLDCPYKGSLRKLYLESKTLELITHSMARFIIPSPATGKPQLRPHEIERIQYARELVGRDLQNPPKLLDLARTVGLPHSKLNSCFRELYGTTIFGYLREIRLNKARSFLDEGRMNVTEVAYAVGYSSLSHFAKAFKKQHGTAPGNYLKEVSSRW